MGSARDASDIFNIWVVHARKYPINGHSGLDTAHKRSTEALDDRGIMQKI